jgi:hypothetical protein
MDNCENPNEDCVIEYDEEHEEEEEPHFPCFMFLKYRVRTQSFKEMLRYLSRAL